MRNQNFQRKKTPWPPQFWKTKALSMKSTRYSLSCWMREDVHRILTVLPSGEVHFHYPVPVFSKFACRWENDSWVTRRDVKGTWGSVQEYNFRQLRWCRVSLSELWGFQRGYRVSLHRNRKSVKNQRANQLMSRSLVLRLYWKFW